MTRPLFLNALHARLFAVPLVMAALGSAGIGYGVLDWRKATAGLAAAAQARQRASAELDRTRLEAADLGKLATGLQQLRREGLLDGANPVAWGALLDRIGVDQRLAPLERRFRPSAAPLRPGWSAVTLSLGGKLVHEGQLPRLIESIRSQAPALTIVRFCRLERQAGGPGLATECEIDWLIPNGAERP